jgi:hypothetical protein
VEGCSPRGERVTTREIGNERFLFLGGAIEIISRADPHRRRPLASIVALVLAAGFFAFCGGEARAQQSPQQHAAVSHEDPLMAAVEEVARLADGASPAEILLAETPFPEMLSTEASPVGLLSLAKKPPDGPVRADPTLVGFDRRAAGKRPVAPVPVREILGDTGAAQEPEPLPGLEAVPTAASWPGALEKKDPPPLPRGERPTANTPVPGVYRTPLSGSEAVGAVPAGPAPSTAVRGTPMAVVPGSPMVGYHPPPRPETAVSGVAANLQSGAGNTANSMDTPASTYAPGGEPSPAAPSSGPGDASESTPQHERTPSSPLAPLGGSSFSLSGGQAGPGSGLTPLLMCVLASGLVLLRRDGLLFRWAPYEPPKPSSALLLPLERPG